MRASQDIASDRRTQLRASCAVVAVAVLAVLAGCAKPSPPASAATPAPSTPNWSGGLWERVAEPGARDIGQLRADALPLTPAWRRKSDALDAIRDKGGELPANDSRCIPSGMPFMMIANGLEFLYSPGRIGIVAGGRGLQIRNIWIDGRAHTPDARLFDSYSGESIGHWEGQTLVVDTIGLRPTNEMVYALPGTHLHVSERFTQRAPDSLEIVTTVEDAQALEKPWVYTTLYTKHPDRVIDDSGYCVSAYDRTVDARTGAQGFDLTPPAEKGIGVPQSLARH